MEVIKTFEAGEVIFNEGDLCDSLYIVKVGKVEIFRQKGEREIVLNVQGPGEVIGLLTFFTHGKRLASARAQTEVQGVLVHHKVNQEQDIIANLPQWVQIVLRDFTVRLEQMNERFMSSAIETDEIKSQLRDPLFMSIQVANCVGELGAREATPAADGRSVIFFEELKGLLTRCLEYDRTTIDRIFHIFDSTDILQVEKEAASQNEFISLENAKKLLWYPEFFRSKPAKNKQLLQVAVKSEDRDVLLALCDYVYKTGGRSDQIYQVELGIVAASLHSITGVTYRPDAIEAGRLLGLVEIKEVDGQLHLWFHPSEMRRSLLVVDIVKRLRSDPAG